MKFRVEPDVFSDAVSWVARTLPVRPSAPVLAGLLIATDETGLVLSSFDYETSSRAGVSAEVVDDGQVLVSGRLLADICKRLPAKPLDVEVTGPTATLVCGSARFTLPTLPVEDYPSIPQLPASSGTVDSGSFSHAVAQAVTAAGRDDMLPVLTGVRMEIEGTNVALLATDRFRLSSCDFTWDPTEGGVTTAALVPAKVLADTAKSFQPGNEVTIALSSGGAGEGLIGFQGKGAGGTRTTTTRLLDGEFPKVRSLFPTERTTVARIDKDALVESITRVALVADRNAAISLTFEDGQLTLDAGTGEDAKASESVEADIEGEGLTTGFNPQYMLDGLGAIDAARVELSFTQATKPVVIRGVDADGQPVEDQDTTFRYLLMPRRLLS